MPTTSLVIASYNQPNAFALVLEGVLALRQPPDQIVIADDGSTPDMLALVERLRLRTRIPVVFTTQEDRGFRKAQALNNALREATGELVLFLDGDCIPPPDWLGNFVRLLAAGADFATAGYVLMDLQRTRSVTLDSVRAGDINDYLHKSDRRRLRWCHCKEVFYGLLRRRRKPRILGGNWAATMAALRAVNGFDERFDGFSKEDSDIRNRLQNAGFRGVSAWDHNWVFHCTHDFDPNRTAPGVWRREPDLDYYRQQLRAVRCTSGLLREPRERHRGAS